MSLAELFDDDMFGCTTYFCIANIPAEERLKDRQKELEALDLEAAFIYFPDTICQEAKADFGAILLENNEQIKLEYARKDGQAAIKYPVGIDSEQVEHLPKKLLRYASRTYEKVIIEAKPTEGPFASDDHIRSRASVSIICLPLKYNHIFAGLIYLESQNNHQFNPMLVEYIQNLSFYLIAKQAMEKEPPFNSEPFINQTVKDQLTERETEVLSYMAEGLSNNKISEKLNISSGTVKTHTLNLYRKLEVNNRVQAVTRGKALDLV
ncbi:MAG: LuxR C-terminal-related transcriptional regulator [Bacillota bacterium]|nr:LuxR C-terminal-related transcriptional regulator [Bacillota bacterium]